MDRESLEPGAWRTSEDDDKADEEKEVREVAGYPRKQSASMMRMSKKDRESAHESMPRSFFITENRIWSSMGTRRSSQDARRSICGTTRQAHSAACRMRLGEFFKGTEKYKRVEQKFEQYLARPLERQDEEDRKRRKVEQEKTEAAGTSHARESELMEETREKRPIEEEVERNNKRSRPRDPEARQASGSTDERRDISMEVDGLDREEIEEDELQIASLEADADGDFGSEDVGDREFEEEFHDNRTGEYLDPELVAKARSEEKRSSSWRRSGSTGRWTSRSVSR